MLSLYYKMYFNCQDCKKVFTLNISPSFFNLRMEWNFGFILIFLYFFQIIFGIILTFFFKVGLEDCLRSKFFIIFSFHNSKFYFIFLNFLFIFLVLY